MEESIKSKLKKIIVALWIVNTIESISAVSIICLSIYLWDKTEANNFVLCMMLFGFPFFIATVYGFTSIKKNSTSTCVYMAMMIIVTSIIVIIGLIIILDYSWLLRVMEANNLIAVFDDLKSRMKFVFIGYYIGVSVFGGLDIWLCKVYRGKLKEFDRAYMEYDKFYNYFIIGEMIYYDSPKLVLWLIQSLLLLRRDNIHNRYIIISINLLFNFHIVFLLLYNLLQILLLFVFNEF